MDRANATEARLRAILARQFGRDVSDDFATATLRDSFDADVLDMHEVIMAVEDEFLAPPLPADPMPSATIADLASWADGVMASRALDLVIGEAYLRRWWIVPRNAWYNVYLHELTGSDDDRALHDHPWANQSFVVAGRYIEHTPEARFVREAGSWIERPAEALHRLEMFPGERAITLFTTGPKLREWGFACPQGWVHWRDFTAGDHGERVGKGCAQ